MKIYFIRFFVFYVQERSFFHFNTGNDFLSTDLTSKDLFTEFSFLCVLWVLINRSLKRVFELFFLLISHSCKRIFLFFSIYVFNHLDFDELIIPSLEIFFHYFLRLSSTRGRSFKRKKNGSKGNEIKKNLIYNNFFPPVTHPLLTNKFLCVWKLYRWCCQE